MISENGSSSLSEICQTVGANSTFMIMNIGGIVFENIDLDNPLAGVLNYVRKVGTVSDFGCLISFGVAYLNDSSQFENIFSN